jgi:hypothetical protein
MDFRTRRALASLAFVLGTSGMAVAQAPPGISGNGETLTGTGELARVIVVRSVVLHADGSVAGELEFRQDVRDPSTGTAAHYVTRERAVCLEVHGNAAWVGTVVTASTNPMFSPGVTEAVWYFEDNGGHADVPDRVNSLHDRAGTAALCRDAGVQRAAEETASLLTRGHFEVGDGS